MECHYCGNEMNNRSKYCINCGKLKSGPKRRSIRVVMIAFSLIAILSATICLLFSNQMDNNKQVESAINKEIILAQKKKIETSEPEEFSRTPKPATEIKVDTQKEVSKIISESLEKVLTIFTEDNQGTGFIINNQGDILTNAHVVEGFINITAIDHATRPYVGKVIGYSNIQDVAIIRIPELANHESLELADEDYASIGEEVIALGSPMGNTNIATLGMISAVNRSFYIGNRIYENIYQMTARISSGSSGGPLLSVKSGQVIGINSARSMEDESIGFSIPLKDVYLLINDWVSNPLSEKEVTAMFYTDNGDYHFEEEKNINKGYFKGGVTTEEQGVYYEIPQEWYMEDQEAENKSGAGKEDIIEKDFSDDSQEEVKELLEENSMDIPVEE